MTTKNIKLSLLFVGLLLIPTINAQQASVVEDEMQQRAREIISQITVDEKISQMMNTTPGIERLNINPYDWWSEALHGVMPTAPNVNPADWTVGEVRAAEVAIVTIGLTPSIEGEEGDAISSPYHGDKVDLKIPEHQMNFLRSIGKDRKNKVVTVVTGGSPMEMEEIAELSDVVVLVWYPGQEGGLALGDLLFSDAGFSGRMPLTFPVAVDGLPAFEDYSQYEVDEVAQLYISTPGAGVSSPISSLIHFKRVKLQPHSSQTVNFVIEPEQLKTVQEDGSKALLKGEYTLSISGAAPGPRSEELGVKSSKVNFKI